MAETITEICNAGLRKVGSEPITDFDTGTSQNAKHCQNIWPILFDATLRSYDWPCARARRQYLATAADEPEFTEDYLYQHVLPVDPWCLRPLRLNESSMEYRIEGRNLLTNYSTVNLLYTKRLTVMAEMDALLSQVMVYLMAMELGPVTQEGKKLPEEILKYLRTIWMPLARGAAGREGQVELSENEKIHRLVKMSDYI